MRSRTVVVTLVAGSIGIAAVTATAAPQGRPGAPAPGLTLLHWWTSPSELAALDSLGAMFRTENSDVPLKIVNAHSHGGGARIFSAVRAAAAAGSPPDAIHVNAGAPLRPYFEAGLLSPVDEVWKAGGLESVVPPVVRAMNQIDGRYYGVPIDVHRNNLVWYNKRLLDAHGIAPGSLTTWKAFFEAAERLKAGGLRYPLQLGVAWTLSVSMEGIVAGMGAAHYSDWVNGAITAPDDRRLLEAFRILRTYLSYVNPDHATMAWDAAIQRIVRGEAAFCIMGDWANGEFRLAKLAYGKDYGAIPLPGTQGMYGAAVDSFAQARGSRSPAGAARLLALVASRRGQDAFNTLKGSIPPRSDADPTDYDAYQKSAIADLEAARVIYPNLAGATHDAFKFGVDGVMSAFQADRNVEKAAAAVAALAAGSRHKFVRVWSSK